jgi:putative IMPACT (imprinted ancient) family translation regulator
MFKTIKSDVTAEIVEKKSKFIANLFYVESVEEAENRIKQINKKYFDARHNCYAFSVVTEDGVINRFSDDGEPSRNSRRTYAKYYNQ